MTPGPTQVAENVRLARSRECTNPDLDASFVEFYKETCEEISRLLHTDNETLILGGEGILGLEAACASMTEPGDHVLVPVSYTHLRAHETGGIISYAVFCL